jgi:hypothetical protein
MGIEISAQGVSRAAESSNILSAIFQTIFGSLTKMLTKRPWNLWNTAS